MHREQIVECSYRLVAKLDEKVDASTGSMLNKNHSPLGFIRLPEEVSIETQGEELAMANLKGTKTHQNLKDAFAGESQANRRYLYFAKVADVEGHPDVAGLF